ncbi:MAG: glycosyltransferase family 9 protein [Williamsia sp.]|nr:glycosyltransferase family 9 protein [Williamsia sp.]
MKILVRLPNWLGDMIMSLGAIQALQEVYPGASISVIAKKGIHPLLDFFPSLSHQFVFSKQEYPGIKGAWIFGKEIRKTERFDLFVCMPDSFSSAIMAYATGARERIGYNKEMRSVLLTRAFSKNQGQHRVEEYIDLVAQYSGRKLPPPDNIFLKAPPSHKEKFIAVNINSEASSRRLPIPKAVSILTALQKNMDRKLVLVGVKDQLPYVEQVMQNMLSTNNIENRCGKTTLAELVACFSSASAVLTTDSGPAHLANALGTNTVVLHGADNERETAPYNDAHHFGLRLGQLSCEPCVKNKCVLYGLPKCLELLDEGLIVETVKKVV